MKISNKRHKEIEQLFNMMSCEKMQTFIDKYHADFSVNKLYSTIFYRLFTYSWILDRSELSLRSIAEYSDSEIFKELANVDKKFSVGKTALSNRLTKIPYEVFQDTFEHIAQNSVKEIPSANKYKDNVARVLSNSVILDSTIITLSVKLLKTGYHINEGQLNLKASVAMSGKQIPVKALLFTDKEYSSEDEALPEVMDFQRKGAVYIFDRGIQRLKTYTDIVRNNSNFVSRLNAATYDVVNTNNLHTAIETPTLIIEKDESIVFKSVKRCDKLPFRLITASSKKDGKVLKFITNLKDISACDVTEIYRHRWSIEIFFRFLKSELHLEKLLSYNENGIKVHMYLVMIAFLLAWIFESVINFV